MKNYFIAVAVLLSALGIAGALVVRAQEATITFPVEELGGCTNEQTCRAYCNESENISACIAFAKKNKLMDENEVAKAEKFATAMASGETPGGCTSEASCRKFCETPKNIKTCLEFGRQHGMMDEKEAQEAERVAAALERGIELPGGCTSKESCEEICSKPENMEMCITFAQEAGLMSGEELEESQKMLAAIKKGVKPPACGGKDACDMYCGEAEHFEECLNFAEAAGFIKPEEAVMARKTGGKGPGGCKRDECKTFCDNPENQEACTKFAIENNLMSAEDLQRMNEGKEKMKEGLGQAPAEVQECLKAAVGEEKLNQIMSGTGFPTQELGEKMRACFEQYSGQMGPPPGEGGERRGPPQWEYREYNGERRGPPEMMGRPEGEYPRDGEMRNGPLPEYDGRMMPPEYQQQYQERRGQMEQQYQEQYRQYQGAPEGGYPPPGDNYGPPSSGEGMMPQGEFSPPPSGESAPPPPPAESAPTSVRYSAVRDMASMLWVFLGMFQ